MDKHLPGRHPIAAFGNGGFRFADMSHQGALLVLPGRMITWPPTHSSGITPDDFSSILRDRDEIDMLLVGTGPSLVMLSPQATQLLRDNAIAFEVMSTSAAVHIYNVVVAEGRRVAAALLPVP